MVRILQHLRHFDTIEVLFVAIFLTSNIVSAKIISLWYFTFDGGTILFPLSYIITDILTEVYGYKKTRRVLWLGLMSAILLSFALIVIGLLPAAVGWENQEAYSKILGLAPRILIASIIAYFVGEFTNSYILAKMKIATNGRWLWTRTISSTIVGEFFDTLLFVTIAFYGVLDRQMLIVIIISNYVFKLGVEILFTPLTYMVVKYLKKAENMDTYDTNTNFNPFSFK